MNTTVRLAPRLPMILALALASFPATLPAAADDAASVTMTKGGFQPSTITVKAGVKVKLSVRNAQSDAAEFESAELNREKVIPPGGCATVYIGPLEPGSYGFFDDFHPSSTGRIVAK